MTPDGKLCYCFHITKRKIVNYVRQTRPRRASQISECFGAGTGCGWCIPFLKRIHREIVAGDIVEADDIGSEEYEALRNRYLEGLKNGTREPNTLAMEGLPPELLDRERGAAAADEAPDRSTATRARSTPLAPPPVEGPWDVSDYFSRPRPADPEPENL